ncbi:MAG: hypothetical protein ACRCSL_03885 [Microbacterium sp.]
MGNESYYHRHMWDSPQGREIERLAGDAGAIISRGGKIESLGDRMQRAANTLRLIADEQVGKGASLDEIKDQAAEVHADLKKAGERYSPSGAALSYYGRRLSEIQPTLNRAVAEAESAWETVRARSSAVDDTSDLPDDEDGGSTGRQEARDDAEGRLESAMTEWRIHATEFDRLYDSWERAYEHARDELQDANDDGVKDGFWDDALPFLEGLVAVLEVVGVLLVIAALVIGGPLLGVIAAVVAVITLLATIILAAKGRKDGKDVALAALGVIPFGKLGKLVKLSDLAAEGARFPRLAGFRNLFFGADDIRSLRTHLSRIDSRAAAAWNFTTNGAPWGQITGGSRFIQRVMSGTPYVFENMPTVLPRSSAMFWGRFTGYGDDLVGLGSFGMKLPVLTAIQGHVTTLNLVSFANDRVEAAAADARVDSWR